MSGIHTGPPPTTEGPPPPPSSDDRQPASARPGEDHPPRALGWGLALVVAGGLWLLALAGVPMPFEVVLPMALVLVGLALLLWPRARGTGLVGVGVVLLVVSLVTVVLPGSASVSAGDRTYVVTDAAELEDAYDLGAGTLVLDLRALEPSSNVALTARVGMGELTVLLPDDVALRGDARVGMGEIEVLGESRGGVAPTFELDDRVEDEAAAALALDLQVGLGTIEVRR
jgi:hypothetical protein